ncbi:unnamed protein product, partial [Staurois parvus]
MRPCTASPLMLLPGPECVMGPPYRLPTCCCQARNLSWAPVPTASHAAVPGPECVMGSLYGLPLLHARPVICHGPLYRLLMLLPGPVCHGSPVRPPHCCCLYRHTLPCATFRS